jgi:hypothetical protein
MFLTRLRQLALFGILFLTLTQAVRSQSTPVFPLKYSADKRYLVDQSSAPFPILGRASWGVIGLSAADAATYLSDTKAKGFTTIEVGIPWRFTTSPLGPAVNVPANGAGALPFTKRLDGGTWSGALSYSNINNEAPDFTTPNEAYWTFVDAFLNSCLNQGIVVAMFPSYTGSNSTDGWMSEMRANGTSRLQTYGAWIATRYKNQQNVIWLIAGDYGAGDLPYTGSDQTYEQAFVSGLLSVSGQQTTLISAEGGSQSISTDLPGSLGTAITLNGAYVGWNTANGATATQARRAYSHAPTIPAFMIEEPYDEEGPDGLNINPSSSQPVRRQLWWAWLSSIGGYISGNGYVWPFKTGVWQNHLNTQTALDLGRLNTFVKSLTWYQLVPSGLGSMGTLITSGGSSVGSADYVAAAATPTGSLLVAYVPPAHTGSITVNMAAMSTQSNARWFDPTNGAYTAAGSSLPNSGGRVFTPPGNNSSGQPDWVLILTTSTATAPAAPTGLHIIIQ